MSETFDFVIVGAGSAGCAMAYRLSEDGKNSVCVLEFGGSDRGPFIQMPSALSYPMNMKLYNWGFEFRDAGLGFAPGGVDGRGHQGLGQEQRHDVGVPA